MNHEYPMLYPNNSYLIILMEFKSFSYGIVDDVCRMSYGIALSPFQSSYFISKMYHRM